MIVNNTHATRKLHVIDTALLPRPLPSCAANDTELGVCEHWCGKQICLMRTDCMRPVALVPRTRLQRVARAWRIWRAKVRVRDLKQHYRALVRGGVYTAEQLTPLRLQIGVARVDRAIAMRP